MDGGVRDCRLPLVLRQLEEEAGMQKSLSLTETVRKNKPAKNRLINGENSILHETGFENESLSPEESENVTGDNEDTSSSMSEVKE
ncbi:rCG36487, partial [Rattus norvegicus]